MRKLLLMLLFPIVFISCDKQSKAERNVSEFIQKFSLNPESYESIEFIDIVETERGYELGHMYRIVNRSGLKEVKTHTFKLTKDMDVYIDMFEYFD